jgi:tyrosine-protein phosphatase YwqE
MKQPLCNHLIQHQHHGPKRFGSNRCVALPCHCLPGLDDGPLGLKEALFLCRSLVSQGTTTVVATPHQLGRFGSTVRRASFHFLDLPFARLVATDAHDCTSRGPCVTEASDMIVRYRGRPLARQLFFERPLALIGLLHEHHMESSKEGRA